MENKPKQNISLAMFTAELTTSSIYSLMSKFIDENCGVNVLEQENTIHSFTYQIKDGHTADVSIFYIQNTNNKNISCENADALFVFADYSNQNIENSLYNILEYIHDNNYDIDDKLLYIIGLYENEKPEMQAVEKLKDLIKENKPLVNFDEMSTQDFLVHMKGLLITIYEHKSETKVIKEKAVDKCTSNCLLF